MLSGGAGGGREGGGSDGECGGRVKAEMASVNVKAVAARVLVAAAKAAPAATESPRRAGVDVPDVSRADEFACGVKSGCEAAR